MSKNIKDLNARLMMDIGCWTGIVGVLSVLVGAYIELAFNITNVWFGTTILSVAAVLVIIGLSLIVCAAIIDSYTREISELNKQRGVLSKRIYDLVDLSHLEDSAMIDQVHSGATWNGIILTVDAFNLDALKDNISTEIQEKQRELCNIINPEKPKTYNFFWRLIN